MTPRIPSFANHPFTPALGIAALGAPALMLLGDAASALMGREAFWLSTMSLWFSFVLFVVASVGLATAAAPTAPRIAGLGGFLAVCGALVGATIMGTDRMAWAMVQHGIDEELARAVMMDPRVFLTSRAPGLAFPIGLMLLAWAARRARVLSVRSAALLALGAFLFPVGRIALGAKVNVVSDVLMVGALAPLGLHWLRTGRKPAERAESSPGSSPTRA